MITWQVRCPRPDCGEVLLNVTANPESATDAVFSELFQEDVRVRYPWCGERGRMMMQPTEAQARWEQVD